jgi:hypothetical protein
MFFFKNPSHFLTDWLIFQGLATKVSQNQIQKYFGLRLPKSSSLVESSIQPNA